MRQIGTEVFASGMDVKAYIGTLTGAIVAGTGIGTLVSKSTTLIRTGEKGVCTRGNRVVFKEVRDLSAPEGHRLAPKIKGPGLRWHAPWNPIHTVSTKDRSNDLELIHVERDKQWTVKSSIMWRVSEEDDAPFRALYKVDNGDLVGSITNLCAEGIRTALLNESIEESAFKTPALLGSLVLDPVREICADSLSDYGLELRRIYIKDCARSIGQMLSRSQAENGEGNDPSGAIFIPESEQAIADGSHLTLIRSDLDPS
jgi:hypothetical protein